MKTLYLVRHAKSDRTMDLADIDRPLNIRGYRDAHSMSSLMREKKFLPDVIISSPAIRAITTALIFCRNFKLDPTDIIIDHNLYETDVKQYMSVIAQTNDQFNSIMLFAHNPTISDLANSLTKPFSDTMPTCGIVGITTNCKLWNDFGSTTGALKLYDYPKNNI